MRCKMNVILFKNESPDTFMNKVLSNENTFECFLKHEVNVITPVIELTSDLDLLFFNYCKIPLYNRFYFIEKVEKIITNKYRLFLKCDVLMSFKDEIKANTETVTRNENLYNAYISDNNFNALNYTSKVIKKFPNEINNDSIILMTVG